MKDILTEKSVKVTVVEENDKSLIIQLFMTEVDGIQGVSIQEQFILEEVIQLYLEK